ncbi:hypothetical protein HOK51_08020 [Candidatus Woesearchaeota archaeon]|jgi:hypothetical protein|nr:hypothetical protein [Candidatus Woesearchaeota archaeon]MBT6519772.1 hypothetical protein [Candidatus Woesearchaeota archaeon]MBT7368151.1 hypothetical protein [Candidatus Woesearchaeota archaeon]
MNQTNLSLKKLKGIKPKGVKTKTSSTFEILLETGFNFVSKYEGFVGMMAYPHQLVSLRDKLCDDYLNSSVSELKFSEKNLIDFLKSRDYKEHSKTETVIFGLYSGLLLNSLTKRNKQINKRTIIQLNNLNYDYLFAYAKDIDTIILNNCKGEQILSGVGRDSVVNNIIVNNFEGEHLMTDTASNGKANFVWVDGFKGNDLGYMLAVDGGSIDFMHVQNFDGTFLGLRFGFGNKENGFINVLSLKNILSGGDLMYMLYAKRIFIDNMRPKSPQHYFKNITADELIIKNSDTKYSGLDRDWSKIEDHNYVGTQKPRIKQVSKGLLAIPKYRKVSKEYKIKQLNNIISNYFKNSTQDPEKFIKSMESIKPNYQNLLNNFYKKLSKKNIKNDI